MAGIEERALLFFCMWCDQFIFANKWLPTTPIIKLQNVYKQDRNLFSCFTKYKWLPTITMIQPSIFLSTEGKQLEFWGCFEGGNYFGPRITKTCWVNFWKNYILHIIRLQTEIPQNSQEVVSDRNIANFSGGGILDQTFQSKILGISEEADFINNQYRQKEYWKILRRWNL